MMKLMTRVLLATSATFLVLSSLALPDLVQPTMQPADSAAERSDREQRLRVMLELGAERIHAVDDLLAGKKDLKQTATRFRDLAFEDPLDVAELLRLCHPANCEENELFYRQVIYYTSTRVRSRDLSESIVKKLEAELASLRAAGRMSLDAPRVSPM
jgi:hypothetical protein